MEYYSAIKMKLISFLAREMDLEIIMLEVSQTMRHKHQMLSLNMWNLKKGHNELLCRTDNDSQTLKTYSFQKKEAGGWEDALGLWDRNAIISFLFIAE